MASLIVTNTTRAVSSFVSSRIRTAMVSLMSGSSSPADTSVNCCSTRRNVRGSRTSGSCTGQMVPFNGPRPFQMGIRSSFVVAGAIPMSGFAGSADAQTSGFVSGPLSWTPVLQLREAGVDSNVFNAPAGGRQDVTGGLGAAVDGSLKVPAFQLAMRGASEYQYFNRYKSQGGLNTNVSL